VGTEYRLTVSGPTPVGQVAERALGDPRVPLTPLKHVLTADLRATHGFSLSAYEVRDGYFSAAGETEGADELEWEIPIGVSVNYNLVKDPDPQARAEQAVLASVAHVLATGTEDLTLLLNGNYLLLTRVGGIVHKFSRDTWWNTIPRANDVIPG
jgi:hypothetical protein